METAVASDCNYEISWISDNYLKFKIKKSPVKRIDSSNDINGNLSDILEKDNQYHQEQQKEQQEQEQQTSPLKRERLQFEDEEDEGGVDKFVTTESTCMPTSIDLKVVTNKNKKKHKKQKSEEDLNSISNNSDSNNYTIDENCSRDQIIEEVKPNLENLKIYTTTIGDNNNNTKITNTINNNSNNNSSSNNNNNNNNNNNTNNNSNNNNSNNNSNNNNSNNNNNNNNNSSENNNTTSTNSYNEDLVYSGNTILGTRDENQDSFFHKNHESDKIRIIGVFDGHGDEGVIASTTSRDVISSYFSKDNLKSENRDYDNFIKTSFQLTNQTLLEKGKETGDWGTTATLAIIDQDQIKVGWVGDSMAVLFRSNNNGKDYTPIQLSNDHKPENAQEKKRITSTGGRVVFRCGCWRVIPNKSDYSNEEIMKQRLALNMSRALGHIILSKYGVSSDPEIQSETLKTGDYVILASDGLWNVLCFKTIVKYIKKCSNPKELTDLLLNVVESRCQSFKIPCDNVTICCYKHLS